MRSKMIYPVVQLVVASLLCFLLGTFMGPRLMSILSSLGEEQPPLTRLVSTILSPNNVVLVSCLIFAAAATLVYGWKTPAGRQFFLSLIDRTPGLRGLRRDFALVRFCRSLALMLECGFTWQHSLSLCESVEDDPLNPAIQRFREQLSEGDLPVALSGLEEFPPLFHSLLLSGYESNKVTPFLLLFANILDEKLQRRTATFLTLLEPLLLAAMGLVVGLIVIASFLPILNLVQKL
jgi:type II secretory pathway component PulF